MSPAGESSAQMAAALLDLSSRLLARLRKDLSAGAAARSTPPGEATFTTAPGQFRLLRVLMLRERITMLELAMHLDVAPPTVTGLIKRLLVQGYVQRVHAEEDWRNIWIQLTPQGRQAVQSYDRQRVARLQQRIERLNPDERDRLQAAFPVLSRLLEEA